MAPSGTIDCLPFLDILIVTPVNGLPWWLSSIAFACNAGTVGDAVLIPGLGRSPGEGHANLLWYSCLKNPMDRGAWQATVHRVAKELDMNEVT